MRLRCRRRAAVSLVMIIVIAGLSGCASWHGLNTLPLPGTQGRGAGSFVIQAQMPDVTNLQPNARVRVADVTVGTVSKIERQGWHALLTMRMNGDVDLPANATAKLGQTSLLGSLHVELAPPTDVPPQGKLHEGSLIPLSHGGAYPTVEQTLAALSMVLNGGGLGQLQDITQAFGTAFRGREQDLRSLIVQLDKFTAYVNDQTGDIIAATDSLNRLVGQFAAQQPVLDRALKTIPDALAVLDSERNSLVEAADQLGKFSALTVDAVNQTKENLVKELQQVGPVLESLANAGPALTRALSFIPTFPFPNETIEKWQRGDYANLTAIVDLTLSRIDASIFTGTKWECDLTELELQWGRTIGQYPSPCTAGGPFNPGNPLTIPYRWDQGPEMHLNRRIKIQLAIFTVIAVVALALMSLHFMQLPARMFGVGRYTVKMELPETGGLYGTGNVTYRGTEVGRVESVHLTDTGVEAVLSLKSGIAIPSDLKAEVHSQTAIGEQYVELLPRNGMSPPLKDGDVIPRADTTVPPDINSVLSAVNSGLQAVPRDDLKTVIDESYTAVGGLGPELSRIVKGSSNLAIDARKNLDPLIALIDQSQPVFDSQTHTSDAIQAWASHLATVTTELQNHDVDVAGILDKGGPAFGEARQLVERLQPTLPIVLANLVSLGQVALTYQPDIEQLLVLLPQSISYAQAGIVANANTKQAYRGQYLSFHLNLNLPPPCTTGFLPAQQQRIPTFEDYPDRPAGDLYCRVPQDSPWNARAARNTPCETVPGKRAPTVKMCESDQQYIPLNNGYNWKGDPNATLSGQDIPQLPPGSPPQGSPPGSPPAATGPPDSAPLPIAAAEYDPATGSYIGPNGRVYTQSDLAQTAPKEKTWQSMLLPPPGS